jgi:trans-2,3-dihydro-3-hydroxyanthranilic acid synthase
MPPLEAYPLPAAHDLPANTATWRVEPGRAALLVHDMQRYFLRPIPEPLHSEVIGNAARLRNACAAAGMPVAYTAQPGSMTQKQRGLLKDFWGPGMTATAQDRRIVDELVPVPADWQLTKWRYSAFHDSDLLRRLREAGRDQLVVCGVYAHVGVLASAVEAFSNDIETFLVADAVADFAESYHRMALGYAAERCAVVATTDQVLAMLAKEAGP